MNKKKLTVYICLFLAIISIATAILFTKLLNNNSTIDDPAQNTETGTLIPNDTVQSSDTTSNISKNTDDNTETVPPSDTSSKKPEENSETSKPVDSSASKPANNTGTTKPTDTSTVKPEEKQDAVSYTANSYKDFTLTAGMSAKEAYEFLDGFLNSKYSILVNKQNKVSSDYVPENLVTVSGSEYRMEKVAAAALENMMRDAASAGYKDLVFYSGYRTYSSQKNKYDTRTNKYLNQGLSQAEAEEKAGEYIAPPGSSEHHTGLAADVCSSSIVSKYGCLSDEFDQTGAWRWLNDHCAQYGFILRYRKESESITGFLYEPWHFRYIGKEHAKCCTGLGMTYEEYHKMLKNFRDDAKEDAGV